jgi:hypothetical protein
MSSGNGAEAPRPGDDRPPKPIEATIPARMDPWAAKPVQTPLCASCGYRHGEVLPFCVRCCRFTLTPLGPFTAEDAAEVASWAVQSVQTPSTGCAA